jgi:hypothetical protein
VAHCRTLLGDRFQELGLCEAMLGKEFPSTLTSVNYLAVVLRDQGNYEELSKQLWTSREALHLRNCDAPLPTRHQSMTSSQHTTIFLVLMSGATSISLPIWTP